jgi:hypothetical protein
MAATNPQGNPVLRTAIRQLCDGGTPPSPDTVRDCVRAMVGGECPPAQVGALLAALRATVRLPGAAIVRAGAEALLAEARPCEVKRGGGAGRGMLSGKGRGGEFLSYFLFYLFRLRLGGPASRVLLCLTIERIR